jgi:hypothetical protein
VRSGTADTSRVYLAAWGSEPCPSGPKTGEEPHRGDRVSYGGNAGVIELVVAVCSTNRSPRHAVGQFALDPRAATD